MSSTQSNYCTEIVKIRPRKYVVIVHNYTLSVKFMQTFLLTKLTHWCMLLIGEWIYFVIRSISNFLSIMTVSLFKPSNNAVYRYSCALCHLSFQKKNSWCNSSCEKLKFRTIPKFKFLLMQAILILCMHVDVYKNALSSCHTFRSKDTCV